MTDKQITALAREYAEETHHGNAVAVDEAILTIRFLLRRFCLVEKEAVRKAYKAAQYSFNNASNPIMPTMEFHNGEMSAIESLFPEIGKEVEK